MENINNNNNSNEETPRMYDDEMIIGLFNNFLEAGGDPKVTSFKRHIDELIKVKVKPLCGGHGKSSVSGGDASNNWRNEQKSRFSGRGAKWVKVSLESIEPTLKRLEAEDVDCSDYRAWTTRAGYAWIRYAGPRLENGIEMAAFEVRTRGSKEDHPQQLHRKYNRNLMDHVELLGGTPHSLNLETSGIPVTPTVTPVVDDSPSDEIPVTPVELEEVQETETPELPQIPDTDDPEVWNEFLASEGLGCDDDFESEDYDQLNDDIF